MKGPIAGTVNGFFRPHAHRQADRLSAFGAWDTTGRNGKEHARTTIPEFVGYGNTTTGTPSYDESARVLPKSGRLARLNWKL